MAQRPLGARVYALAIAVLFTAPIAGCSDSDLPDDETNPARAHRIAEVVSADAALSGAHLPTLDPSTMSVPETTKVVGAGPRCEFRYTTAGKAVVAMSAPSPAQAPTAGVVKLNGSLVSLAPVSPPTQTEPRDVILAAEPIRITVTPDPEPARNEGELIRKEANMIFEVGDSVRVGYRGYLDCAPTPPRITHRRS